jgi:DNA topoisomerase IB
VRRGSGFSYHDSDGRRIGDESVLERIRELAIPPAWQDVWICIDPLGHLQATGTDAAGRKQYLYHSLWSERRDRVKFERMIRFARGQPDLRERVAADLKGRDVSRERVLACAIRLLDLGMFRVGGDEYAEENGSFGLTTLRREHLTIKGDVLRFAYAGKSGVQRAQAIHDPGCLGLLKTLRRRRGGDPELLAYRDARRWVRLRAEDINDHLKAILGEEFTAKDFRTWNATVIAASSLASPGSSAGTKTGRERAIKQAVGTVAELLGNTPAVARRSYIDPRIFDRYRSGWVIAAESFDGGDPALVDGALRARLESAVLDLLTDYRASEAVTRI